MYTGRLEFQLMTELYPIAHEPILGQLVLAFPVSQRGWRQRFAMIREIGRDHAEAGSDFAILENVPILTSVRACRMLTHQRYSPTRLLDIDAVLDIIQFKIQITPDDI